MLIVLSAEVFVDIRQFQNVVAIRSQDGASIWGFHSHNMELFALSQAVWEKMDQVLSSPTGPVQNDPIWQEIQDWSAFQNPETQVARDAHSIKSLSINVVQICNLRCTYCSAGGDGSYGSKVKKLDLSLAYKQVEHFLRQYRQEKPNEKFQIHFLGGEPLLHVDIIRKLCQYALLCAAGTGIQLVFSVTTNGTLITEQVAQMLAEFKFSIAVSLDGPPEINDSVRPIKGRSEGSTKKTIEGIQNLLPHKDQLSGLQVNSVFGPHNLNVLKTYNFLMNLYPDWESLNFLYANNDPSSDDVNSQTYISEMQKVAESAYQKRGLHGLAQIKQFQSVLSRVAAQTRIESYCGAGKSLVQIDTRGDLYTCNWFMNDPSEKAGHGTELNSDHLKAYTPSLIELNNCQKCWARHFCGGGCLYVHKEKTGNKHQKDPNFCQRTRTLGATALHYYGVANEG